MALLFIVKDPLPRVKVPESGLRLIRVNKNPLNFPR